MLFVPDNRCYQLDNLERLSTSLAEMTFGIRAFGAVFAKTSVAQEGKFGCADFLTCKNSRQHQIQDCDPMVEAARRYTEKGHLTQISDEEHGAGKHGSAVVELSRSCQPDSIPGNIIRIHTHPAAQQKQVATTVQLATDDPVDHLSVIRGKVKGDHL